MIIFRHVNLDISVAEYKNLKIELKKNQEGDWEVWVAGKKTKSNYYSRKEAIDAINLVIDRIDPQPKGPVIKCKSCNKEIMLVPGVGNCKECGAPINRRHHAPQRKGCLRCGLHGVHRCIARKPNTSSPKPFSPNSRGK